MGNGGRLEMRNNRRLIKLKEKEVTREKDTRNTIKTRRRSLEEIQRDVIKIDRKE